MTFLLVSSSNSALCALGRDWVELVDKADSVQLKSKPIKAVATVAKDKTPNLRNKVSFTPSLQFLLIIWAVTRTAPSRRRLFSIQEAINQAP